jgi:hypothetical protein
MNDVQKLAPTILVIAMSALCAGGCVKRIDYGSASKEALAKSLCPEIQRQADECEADLREAEHDLGQAEREANECRLRNQP